MSHLHQLCTEVPVTQLLELLVRFGTYNSPGQLIYIKAFGTLLFMDTICYWAFQLLRH